MRSNDYKTRQKELILNFFIENKEKHLTAAEILKHMNAQDSNVSMTTIYRCIEKLVSSGCVRKYFLDERSGACYQYIEDGHTCHEHFHLKCIECGMLTHLDCQHMQSLNQHILKHHGFTVDNSRTVLYGICEKCLKRNER